MGRGGGSHLIMFTGSFVWGEEATWSLLVDAFEEGEEVDHRLILCHPLVELGEVVERLAIEVGVGLALEVTKLV